jgi:hypothetical protein
LKAGLALAPRQAFGTFKLAAFASTVVVPVFLAQVLGVWRQAGFTPPAASPATIFFLSLLSCALFLSMGVHPQEHGNNGRKLERGAVAGGHHVDCGNDVRRSPLRDGSLWLTILVHMLLNLSIIYSNVAVAAGPAAMLVVRRLANVVEFAVVVYERRAAWDHMCKTEQPAPHARHYIDQPIELA